MIVVTMEEQGIIASEAWRSQLVMASEAKQSRVKGDIWIASSLPLLAMTDEWLIVLPSKPLSDVIPDARNARDGEFRARPEFLDRLWSSGQAFGLPRMTSPANGSTGDRMA